MAWAAPVVSTARVDTRKSVTVGAVRSSCERTRNVVCHARGLRLDGEIAGETAATSRRRTLPTRYLPSGMPLGTVTEARHVPSVAVPDTKVAVPRM